MIYVDKIILKSENNFKKWIINLFDFQLIMSVDSERVYMQCSNGMPDLRMVSNSKMSEEDLSLLTDIMQKFRRYL